MKKIFSEKGCRKVGQMYADIVGRGRIAGQQGRDAQCVVRVDMQAARAAVGSDLGALV